MSNEQHRLRLGELLVRHGALSQDALAAALRHQAGYGARLGTNLIELGSLAPDHVSRGLARQHGVDVALAWHFARCEPRAVEILPRDVAAWFNALPLALAADGGTRSLVDPMLAPDGS